MKVLVFLAVIGYASCAQFVWDLLKPALNAAEVQALLSSARAGQDYPTYNDIPQTSFDCNSKKQPGFYADTEAQCQVFHRCDINGNMTSYLCVNTTVFNQITLICDYYFNVDCSKAQSYENFANSRLYKADQPLFDSPPADYLTPQQKNQQQGRSMDESGSNNNVQPAPPKPGKPVRPVAPKPPGPGPKPAPPKPAPPKPGRVTPTTTVAATTEQSTTQQAGDQTTSGEAQTTTQAAGEETTSAGASGSEDTTSAAAGDQTTSAEAGNGAETTTAAGGEDTTTVAASGDQDTSAAASGEDTTTAAAGGDQDTSAASGAAEETTTAASS